MSNFAEDFNGGLIIGAIIGFTLFIIIAVTTCNTPRQWRAEAIEHNAAHYHPQTGEFTWNEPSGADSE